MSSLEMGKFFPPSIVGRDINNWLNTDFKSIICIKNFKVEIEYMIPRIVE